ncbi:MAG: hypothetical protein K2J87_01155, partial [Muribaculaceae bacterium]|nr:hypothetical protein [Muribaculaceae bacterium]
TLINLAGLFSDADSMEAAIVKSIVSVSNPSEFKAKMMNGDLEIMPVNVSEGSRGYVEIKGNSNGKIAMARLELLFSTSGIGEITALSGFGEVEYYNLQGERIKNPEKGVYIRRCGGKAEKIIL